MSEAIFHQSKKLLPLSVESQLWANFSQTTRFLSVLRSPEVVIGRWGFDA